VSIKVVVFVGMMRGRSSLVMNHWLNVISTDIAGTSVDQCVTRYKEMLERARRERGSQKTFQAEFITADCSKVQYSMNVNHHICYTSYLECSKYDSLSLVRSTSEYIDWQTVCVHTMQSVGQQEGDGHPSCCNNSQKFICGLTSPMWSNDVHLYFVVQVKSKIVFVIQA